MCRFVDELQPRGASGAELKEDRVFVQKAAEELQFQQPISGCILNHPRQSSAQKPLRDLRGVTPATVQSERAAAKQDEKKTNWTVFLRAPRRDSSLAN